MRNTNEIFIFWLQTHPEMTLIYIAQELEGYLGLILTEGGVDMEVFVLLVFMFSF